MLETLQLEESAPEQRPGLKATLTFPNCISILIGSIIGSGILVSPSGVLLNAGSTNMALVVWTVSGLLALLGSYCYAELGSMIPRNGDDYVYINMAFGPMTAFIRLWAEIMIVRPCLLAIVGLTFATFSLKPGFPDGYPPNEYVCALAIVAICFLTFVNCWSVRWAVVIQEWTTYAKVLALLVINGIGGHQLCLGKTAHFTWEYDGKTEMDPTKLVLSFYSATFAYNGWNNLNYMTEEIKHPVRDLPRAVITSGIIVTVLNVFTNVAYFAVLSPEEILRSPSVAATFVERLYGYSKYLLPIVIALSTFGYMNGLLLVSSRLVQAAALEGQMPQLLSMIQTRKHTPVPAILFVALASVVYALCSPSTLLLLNYAGFSTWLNISLAVLCIPVLRWKRPDLPRPIGINLFWPFLYIICTISITVVPMIMDKLSTRIGLSLIFTAVPVRVICRLLKNKPKFLHNIFGSITCFFQNLFDVQPPERRASL